MLRNTDSSADPMRTHAAWRGSASRACPGVPTIFHWGGRPKGQKSGPKAESGVGFLGRGQQAPPPPHQPGGLGSAVSSPGGFRGGAWTAQRFSTIFSTPDVLSWHYSIVNCGLSCSHWGPDPRALPLPLRTPLQCVVVGRLRDRRSGRISAAPLRRRR